MQSTVRVANGTPSPRWNDDENVAVQGFSNFVKARIQILLEDLSRREPSDIFQQLDKRGVKLPKHMLKKAEDTFAKKLAKEFVGFSSERDGPAKGWSDEEVTILKQFSSQLSFSIQDLLRELKARKPSAIYKKLRREGADVRVIDSQQSQPSGSVFPSADVRVIDSQQSQPSGSVFPSADVPTDSQEEMNMLSVEPESRKSAESSLMSVSEVMEEMER